MIKKKGKKKKKKQPRNITSHTNVSSSSIFFQDLHGFSKRQSEMATFNG